VRRAVTQAVGMPLRATLGAPSNRGAPQSTERYFLKASVSRRAVSGLSTRTTP
jgi:hypothetical protein